MANLARLLIHGLGTANALYADYYFKHHVNVPEDHLFYKQFSVFWGPRNFLTTWNLMFQGVFFFLCLVNDIFGSNKLQHSSSIRKIVDFLYSGVIFPVGMFVGSMFWAIFLLDRQLVFPKELDEILPPWFNHLMHSHIIVLCLGQCIFCYNKPNKNGLLALYVVIFAYTACVFHIYFAEGVWIYPILEILNWPARIAFIGSSFLVAHFFFNIGKSFTHFLWGDEVKKAEKETRLKSL